MKYINLLNTMNDYGLETQKAMKNVLIKNNKRATGSLINSIEYDIVKNKKGIYELVIDYNKYGQFVAGRNRKNEPGHSPKWARKGPPVKAIRRWLMAKNIRFKSLNKKGLSYKQKLDTMTYLVIRGIKRRQRLNPRYKNPTDFVRPSEKILGGKRYKKDLSKALKKDIVAQLRKNN